MPGCAEPPDVSAAHTIPPELAASCKRAGAHPNGAFRGTATRRTPSRQIQRGVKKMSCQVLPAAPHVLDAKNCSQIWLKQPPQSLLFLCSNQPLHLFQWQSCYLGGIPAHLEVLKGCHDTSALAHCIATHTHTYKQLLGFWKKEPFLHSFQTSMYLCSPDSATAALSLVFWTPHKTQLTQAFNACGTEHEIR